MIITITTAGHVTATPSQDRAPEWWWGTTFGMIQKTESSCNSFVDCQAIYSIYQHSLFNLRAVTWTDSQATRRVVPVKTTIKMASQITSLMIVYSTVYSGADQRKGQSFAPLAFVRGIHRWPVNSPHKGPVTRKFFPFDEVTMTKQHGPFLFW